MANSYLGNLKDWLLLYKLQLNGTKTENFVFRTADKCIYTVITILKKIHDVIEEVKEQNFVGMFQWGAQMEYSHKQARGWVIASRRICIRIMKCYTRMAKNEYLRSNFLLYSKLSKPVFTLATQPHPQSGCEHGCLKMQYKFTRSWWWKRGDPNRGCNSNDSANSALLCLIGVLRLQYITIGCCFSIKE